MYPRYQTEIYSGFWPGYDLAACERPGLLNGFAKGMGKGMVKGRSVFKPRSIPHLDLLHLDTSGAANDAGAVVDHQFDVEVIVGSIKFYGFPIRPTQDPGAAGVQLGDAKFRCRALGLAIARLGGKVQCFAIPPSLAHCDLWKVDADNGRFIELGEVGCIENTGPGAFGAYPACHAARIPLTSGMSLVEPEAKRKFSSLPIPSGLYMRVRGFPDSLFCRAIGELAREL